MNAKTRKAARLADVARMAKVSTATVSRALTLPHKVKARTLERVRHAARDALQPLRQHGKIDGVAAGFRGGA